MPRISVACAILALALTIPSHAADANIETVVVTGIHGIAMAPLPAATIESVTANTAAVRNNVVTTEDMLKYLPDILVRQRHFGDTQDPIATRTSGVGSSARSLIYADGILLSSLIGNNNGNASPHWGLAQPQDVERIDVLYGPFAAQYPGNSLGATVVITTHMPDRFEMYGKAVTAFQSFDQYGTKGTYGTYQMDAGLGDKTGDFSWRFSLDHLDTNSQPLAYVTLAQTGAHPGGTAAAIDGALPSLNRQGAPMLTIGAGGFEHQIEDTGTLKLGYALTPVWTLSYTASLFHQDDVATAQSYLKDGAGNPVYAGAVSIGGRNYTIPASAFSNNIYRWGQTQLAQALSLQSDTGSDWEWSAIVTRFDDLQDDQRVPSLALPAARMGGAGTATRMNGTAWMTFDVSGEWHDGGDHAVSFGLHRDVYHLEDAVDNVSNWLAGGAGALSGLARGTTSTNAVWAQDDWHFAPAFHVVIGGRYERWRAYDGLNYSLTPPLYVTQPKESASTFSPKLSLVWHDGNPWTLRASFGEAYRMPTVGELYQTVATGPSLAAANPNLKPEHGRAYDLTAIRKDDDGNVQLSFFQQDIWNALLSQSAPLAPGSTDLYKFVQNVDRVRTRGIELTLDRRNVLPGLDIAGSATYVDSRILRDSAYAAAIGKRTPQIPKWRATAIATWHANPKLSVSLAARYSDPTFGTIDNSDNVSNTWQGFAAYFVADLRMHYKLTDHWNASLGVDNLGDRKYFLYHPFPQRTFIMDLRYAA